jgi:hypothetical protein
VKRTTTLVSIRYQWVEGGSYPRTMQPSSARRLACSQALAESAASTVPPVLPSWSGCDAVNQEFTTKLELASSRYGWLDVYMVWMAFRRVVVETWVDCWAAEFPPRLPPWIEEVVEYIDIRFMAAMMSGFRMSSTHRLQSLFVGDIFFFQTTKTRSPPEFFLSGIRTLDVNYRIRLK